MSTLTTTRFSRFFGFVSAFSVLLPVLVATLLFSLSASYAYAATPTLSLSNENNGYIQVVVNGDANSSVTLYYSNPYGTYANSAPVLAGTIGSTNYYGTLSTSINPSSYAIPYNATVYVTVDNQNSSNSQWPYYGSQSNTLSGINTNSAYPPYYTSPAGLPLGTPVGALSFSQSSVGLAVGQTTAIGVYGTFSGIPFSVSSNSNASVVSASANGSDIDVTGLAYGSSIITVCENGTNICNTITVYVSAPAQAIYPVVSPYVYSAPTYVPSYQPSYQPVYTPVSLSQSGISLSLGQSQSVQIYGSGSYYVYSNSNPSVASVTVGGNWLSVSGGQPGSTYITVCGSDSSSSCANLSVTVLAPAPVYNYFWQPITYAVQPIIRPVQRFFSDFPWRRSR